MCRACPLLFFAIRGLRTRAVPVPGTRALDVAVIGAPNVGKSLFTNQLVRAAVSAVSSKMDTTTKNVCAAVTEDDVQLVVVDSPGTVGITHAREVMGLEKAKGDILLADPEYAVSHANHILVVQDATATGDYLHHRVMHLLHRHSHIPSSLVINKIDLVGDRTQLLALTRILTNGRVGGKPIKTVQTTIGNLGKKKDEFTLHDDKVKEKSVEYQEKYRAIVDTPPGKIGFAETKRFFRDQAGWAGFSAVFFVSSLTGEGVDAVREYLKSLSEQRKWKMDENAITNKSPQSLCVESVRAALLDLVPSNIAYRLQPKIIEWKEDGEVLQIVVEVNTDKPRIGRLLVGKGGSRIIEIGKRVNDHLATLFQSQLFVRILIKTNGKVVE